MTIEVHQHTNNDGLQDQSPSCSPDSEEPEETESYGAFPAGDFDPQMVLDSDAVIRDRATKAQESCRQQTTTQPGNKIVRPVIDNRPAHEGFEFDQARGFPSFTPKMSVSNRDTDSAMSVKRQADFGGSRPKVKLTKDTKETQQMPMQSGKYSSHDIARETRPPMSDQNRHPMHTKFEPEYKPQDSTHGALVAPAYETFASEDLTAAEHKTLENNASIEKPARHQASVSSELQTSFPNDVEEGPSISHTSEDEGLQAQMPSRATELRADFCEDSLIRQVPRLQGSDCAQNAQDANTNNNTTSSRSPIRGLPPSMSRPLPRELSKQSELDTASKMHLACDRSKVTKPNTPKAHGSPHPTRQAQSGRSEKDKVLSSEQLFKMFMFRRHKEEEQHQLDEKQLQEANASVEKLLIDVALLQQALQQAHLEKEARDVDLQQCRQKLARFKERGTNLQKFVDGLVRDHQKLRDDTNVLESHLRDLTKAKKELESTMEDERSHYNATLKLKLKELLAAREEIMELERQLDEQEQDLVNHNELIDYERHRNDELHEELSAVSDKQSKIIEAVQMNQSVMMTRVESLPNMELITSNLLRRIAPETILHTIQHNANLLQALHNKPSTSSADIGKLNSNINTYANNLTNALNDQRGQNEESTLSISKAIKDVKEILEKFSLAVGSERETSQMIAELRESNSLLAERLKQKTTELSALSQRCDDLTLQYQTRQETVRTLEKEVITLRSRPQPDPELPLRLRESERAQDELRTETRGLEKLLEQRQGQNEAKDEEARKLRQQLELLSKHVENAEKANASLGEAIQTAIMEKTTKLEELRTQLLKEADIEKTDIKRKHEQNVYALANSRDVAERHVATLQEENEVLKTSSTFATDRVNSLEKRIEEARDREKQLNETNSSQEQRLQRAESEVQIWKENSEASAARCTELASRLKITESDSAAMDGKIQSLTQSLSESQVLAVQVRDLKGRLKSAQKEKALVEETLMHLQQTVSEAQPREKSFHSSDDSGFQAGGDASSPCARYQRDGASKPLPSTIQETQQSPIVRFCSSIWDKALGSAHETQKPEMIGPQVPPPKGAGGFCDTTNVTRDEFRAPLSGQSPDDLHDDIDLIAALEAEDSTQEYHTCPTKRTDCNGGGRNNNTDVQKSTIQETPQSVAQESQLSLQTKPQKAPTRKPQQRINGQDNVYQIPRSREQEQQGLGDKVSHHFNLKDVNTIQGLNKSVIHPEPASKLPRADSIAETETRSNSSRRRTPSRTLPPLRLSPNARPLQELHGNIIRNATGAASPFEHGAEGKKRPSPNDNSEQSAGLLSRPNKFLRLRQGSSKASASTGENGAKVAPDHLSRGSRRVSKGEVRGLGPIVGSVHSPSAESSHHVRRRKSRRKASGTSNS